MKKIMFATLVAVAAISGFIGYFNQQTNQQLSALAIANVEALTDDQERPKSPDYNYVPDHYIEVECIRCDVTCTKRGELQIGSHILSGSYERGQNYTIIYELKNCDGVQDGACCGQREVGMHIVD